MIPEIGVELIQVKLAVTASNKWMHTLYPGLGEHRNHCHTHIVTTGFFQLVQFPDKFSLWDQVWFTMRHATEKECLLSLVFPIHPISHNVVFSWRW